MDGLVVSESIVTVIGEDYWQACGFVESCHALEIHVLLGLKLSVLAVMPLGL